MEEIKYTILYCVCENLFDSILLRFQFRFCFGKKLLFLRFRLRNTGISPAFLRWYEVAYQPFCHELGEIKNFSYSLFREADLSTLRPRV
jgi:hypothetical protein